MSNSITLQFSSPTLPAKGTLVFLATTENPIPVQLESWDAENNGILKKAAKFTNFEGKRNQVLDLFSTVNMKQTSQFSRIIVLGIGDMADFSTKDWKLVGGLVSGVMISKNIIEAHLTFPEDKDVNQVKSVAELALGVRLRSYKFEEYKSKITDKKSTKDKNLAKITFHCKNHTAAKEEYNNRCGPIADGVVLARDLVNEPANVLGPDEFARRIGALKTHGLEIDVMDEAKLKKLKMNALLGVGQGSRQGSYLAVMKWLGGNKTDKPIAIVGKGVCFDTGGISIKGAAGMEDMKGDMGGAACVTGLMTTLAKRKAKLNVIGVVGLVENMPDGIAQRPGDIITSLSGQTIEVINTDAEGRLVLADCLWYTQEKFKPKVMINLATLTGAIMVALGKEHAGLFSNDDQLAADLIQAGLDTGERVWRMPLDKNYDKLIDSKFADMKNTGGRWGGCITAAQFLQRFVNDTKWAHLDIAGTAMASNNTDINESWGSGFGVELLNHYISSQFER